jgi:hypothetical protein
MFLIILAGAGSFRFAFGHFDAANASGIVVSEVDRTVGSKPVQDSLTKADRLPVVAYALPAPDAAELAKAAYAAAELLINRRLLIDGRRRPPLPSSGRREFKNPNANSRSRMTSPANHSRPWIRRPASWKSSMHFAGRSVCQLAATASRTGQANRRRNCNTLATLGEGQSKVDLRLRAAKGPLIPL